MASSSNNIRYKFDNVLVANSRLLVDMDVESPASGRQPEVLILNSKLNKCSSNKTQICDSCCLRIESSEFKRRLLSISKNVDEQQQLDCYGKFQPPLSI